MAEAAYTEIGRITGCNQEIIVTGTSRRMTRDRSPSKSTRPLQFLLVHGCVHPLVLLHIVA